MTKYVALIQQGMVLDQKVIAEGDDQEWLLQRAQREVDKINSEQTGISEGYNAVVLPVELPS